MSYSEHVARRLSKKFVDLYLTEGPPEAGRFFLEHVMSVEETTPELEEFWKKEIKEEFDRQGYELVKVTEQ